jgi:hypothetical protein
MTTLERANQLSDATFSNIEIVFYYLFATPIGWTFWGVLAGLIIWGFLIDLAELPPKQSKEAIAEAERKYKEAFPGADK